MERLYTRAYAKINLSLDVCGRREDGYHLLKTVMQEISLYDELWSEAGEDISILCHNADMPPVQNNIIYKVARAFFAHTGIKGRGVKFTLIKNIPSGAGLGGGSADGVAALRLLDEMFGTALTPAEMVEIVAPIGADLPFFVYGGTALCEGIGERVTPLPPLQNGAFLLVKPPVFMSTPKIFGVLDEMEEAYHPDVDAMVRALGNATDMGVVMGNSLQCAGERDYDFIAPLASQLLQLGAAGAMLSGSGSTVYGIFETVQKAEQAQKAFDADTLFCGVYTPVSRKSE